MVNPRSEMKSITLRLGMARPMQLDWHLDDVPDGIQERYCTINQTRAGIFK